jgi:O-methyltransferase
MTAIKSRSVRKRVRPNGSSIHPAEIMDALADGWVGRLLSIPGHIQGRNTRLSVAQEVTKMMANAFDYARAEQVDGDYAEFGVWQGRTFVEAYRVARRFRAYDRRFFAFDSFAGLPDIADVDAGYQWTAGQFAHGRSVFEARLRRARVPARDVTIVEGFFDQTLSAPEGIGLDRVAVAWIDCDLYESTVPVLDYLTDRLVPGAVLAFDDWYCFRGARDRGESRACAEWLERNPDISLVRWREFHWAGQAFLVQRTGSADGQPPPS